MATELMRTNDGDDLVAGPAPLTPQEETFCRAFGDPESETYGKGAKSAAAAKYSEPHNAAWKLRRRPRIIARLEEMQEEASAALGKVMSDLEHTRLRALAEGGAAGLAVAARCSELQGKRLGAFRDVFAVDDPAERREWDEKMAVEVSRLARLLIEQDGDRLLGLPAPGEPALEGKTVGPAGLGALPEPKPAPASERNE